MTKKHIEVLAAAIVITRESLAVDGHVDPLITMALDRVATEVAIVCMAGRTSFEFNRADFLKAAGVTP